MSYIKRMTAYFIRRILLIIPTFLGITILVFTITRFVPGGPIERIIAQIQQMPSIEGGTSSGRANEQSQPLSAEQIEELKKYYGFDKPVLTSYFLWPVWVSAHAKGKKARKTMARRFAGEVLRLAMHGMLRADSHVILQAYLKRNLSLA